MNKKQTVHCSHCQKTVGYHFDPVNHWKNLFLTILTFGLWLPMWLSSVFGPTKMCDECHEPIWDTN